MSLARDGRKGYTQGETRGHFDEGLKIPQDPTFGQSVVMTVPGAGRGRKSLREDHLRREASLVRKGDRGTKISVTEKVNNKGTRPEDIVQGCHQSYIELSVQ